MTEKSSQENIGDKDTLRTITRGFSIVEFLYRSRGATAKEVAEEFDLPLSTSYIYLNTICSTGYVVKNADKFEPGLRFLHLGSGIRSQMDVYNAAKNHLKPVAEKSNELVELLVEEDGMGVIVMREESERAIDDNTRVGQREYLHASAVGKAILAHLPENRVAEIIERHGLPSQTPNTITDEEELYDQLEQIRETGIAFSEEESVRGVRGVGTPIVMDDGIVQGAVSISGPINRISDDRLNNELKKLILEVSNVIELEIRHYD